MSNAMKFQLLLLCALVTGAAYGQEKQSQPDKLIYAADPANVPDAIAKVKSGDFNGVHIAMIARAGAVEAIPILKQQFSRSQDPLIKSEIAAALVRLGVKDDTYWGLLVEGATPGLETDAPRVMRFDSQPGPSPEFVDWAKAHNITTDSALDTLYRSALAVALLAKTADPRGIPLLRRALLSPYFLTQAYAAEGLANIQDRESIPLIVEACKREPAAAAAVIAKSLVYFDDPEAQRAVDTYVPADMAKLYRKARADGKTPFGEKAPNE